MYFGKFQFEITLCISFADLNKIEKMSFSFCNYDGEEGLTWNEVKQCEVIQNFIFKDKIMICIIQDDYSHFFVGITLPSEENFKFFDDNDDGTLFFEEWLDVMVNGSKKK